MRQEFRSVWQAFLDLTMLRKLRHMLDKLWVRITAIALLSLVAIAVARLTDPLLPDGLKEVVGAGSIDRLLQIIASSMLAVTTFSLTVIVSVFRSASGQWTPRVHRLMVEDKITQNVLATLIGAYIYALSSIILLNTNLFMDDQVVVLFMFTILILILIIIAIVRWVVHLQTLGSLIEVSRRIEEQTRRAFTDRMDHPCLGGHPLTDDVTIPQNATVITAGQTGYIQHIFQGSLQEAAEEADAKLYLTGTVGRFVFEGEEIARSTVKDDDLCKAVLANMIIGDLRTFEQDPRFGLIVLGEIGSRALSPGINDPGTAIDVLGRMARILESFSGEMEVDAEEVRHDRLWVPPLDAADLIEDGFEPIARDGGAIVEVQSMLQKALARLANHPEAALSNAAQDAARRALERAEHRMDFGDDLERLKRRTPAEVKNAQSAS